MKKYINGDRMVIEMTVKEALFCNVLWEQEKLPFSCAKKKWLMFQIQNTTTF